MGHLLTQEVLPLLKLAGVLFLVYLVASNLATWYRLRRFRGPILARFSYLYMLRALLSGDRGQRYRNLYDEYGGETFLRIGPNDLLVSSPAMVRHMNSVRSPYLRSNWYRAQRIDPYRDNLLSLSDTAQHDKLKARLAAGYSGKENPAIETGVDEQLERLVALIKRKYISTASEFCPLDLAPTTMFFAVDTISRIAFGKAFGNLDEDRDIYSFHKFAEVSSMKGSAFAEIPWLGKMFFFPPVLRLIGPKGSFVRYGVSPEQCKSEIVFQILAGSDTTAHAIRATMLNIITSPRVYERIRVEIDAAIADGRIQSSPAKAEEVKQLPYMQAVIREGLRFSPPTTALIQKQVPPEGDTFDDRFLPGGTRIAVSILPIQRSKEVFGQDSEVFRPERWLDISDEKYREMSQTVDQVFGWGRWQCLGKPVAMLELNKVFVELLRYFDFELVNTQSPWKSIDYTLYVVSDFWVRVTEKSTSL
ncbi:cytochrome P450 [Hypoxylon rubiginosum]|uniref:Cytochrome P450 n=1 Tax=Hypoxylon rubiginosum TaxID=110542 RepID=A0ACB9Z6E4_9PEZI|nr:cytochrome P450 [Hypoxylon rubiginosum]